MPRFVMNVNLTHPPEFELIPDIMEQAKENAKRAKVGFEIGHDFDEGMRDADVVYAKSWGAMLTTTDEEQGKKIIDQYPDWITDSRRMAMANDDAVYMHPLPADRNIEVTDEVIDGPQSVVYDEAENRLHGQKAVMALTMS
jgi:N-acetylornithine carbamoyltransferase